MQQLTTTQRNIKWFFYGLAVASVAAIIFLLISPWTVATGRFLGAYTSFNIFQSGSMARQMNAALPETVLSNPMQIFTSRAVMYQIWFSATILLLLGYLVLIFKNHKRSVVVGALGFASVVLLSFVYINDLFETNGTMAFRGRLFDEGFLHLQPAAFITLLFALLCLSACFPITIKWFSGRPIKEKQKSVAVVKGGGKAGAGKTLWRDIKRDKLLYLMLVLPVTYFILFNYLPFEGLRMAFYDFSLLRGYGDFVGLANFIEFFTDDLFWRVLRNTLLLNIYTLAWSFPAPIILALLFNEVRNKRFRTLSQTISYIPNFISTMIVAGLLVNFLSPTGGLINNIRGWFGADPIFFLAAPQYFRTIFVTQAIWVGAGFGSIIYYSSLQSIDTELYESATIDGAGRFKQCIYISIPGISRTISIMLILAIGGLLASNVDMIMLLQQPVTYEVSDVIGTYLLRLAHIGPASPVGRLPDFSMATAVGLFNGIIACFLVVSANKVSKLFGETSLF